jgi:hypothetical protein
MNVIAGMISPEMNCAPTLGAFPAGLLLRIPFGPAAQFRTMASTPSGLRAVTAVPISEPIRMVTVLSTLADLGRSEAGCWSPPASLHLAYLLGDGPKFVLDVLRCLEIHLEQRHHF